MTEEEKKEFEEFLQWKAEKKKEERVKVEESNVSASEKIAFPEKDKNKVSNDNNIACPQDDSGDSYSFYSKVIAIIIGVVMIFLIIVCIRTGNLTTGKTKKSTPEQMAYSKEQDSLAKVKELKLAQEKHRQDSIKRTARIELLKNTVRIKKAYLSSPNSAGGIDVTIVFKNVSNKTIKYFRWSGYPINAVGDPVSCTIRDYTESGGTATGPIKPGATYGYGKIWECVWYNYSAKKLILTEVNIEYMDGSSITIGKNELKYIR